MDGPQHIRRQLSFLALSFAVLGALSLVGGALLAVLGLAGGGALALGGALGEGAGLATLAVFGGIVIALCGVPELAAWVGLTRRQPWGRWLAIALCAGSLAVFPLGTLFGSWGLWVLLSRAALAEFRIERSWLVDGSALWLGWATRSRDRDVRYDGRHRRSRGGGVGCLALFVLLAGFMMFVSCAEVMSSCAGNVVGGRHGYEHMTPRAKLEEVWRATGGARLDVDGSGGANGDGPGQSLEPAPTPAPAPPPAEPAAGGSGQAGAPSGQPSAAPAPPPVPEPPARSRAMFIYTDEDGTPVIVDDEKKVPASRRHTLRSP
jgi:hypothetical protein